MKCLTILLFLLVTSTYSHFIVFENIGQMATAVTYLQVKLTLKVSITEKVVQEYKAYLESLYKQFVDLQKNPKIMDGTHGEAKALAQQCEEMVYTYMMDSRNLGDEFNTIRWLLPTPGTRQERQLLGALGLALGTMALSWDYTTQLKFNNSKLLWQTLSLHRIK